MSETLYIYRTGLRVFAGLIEILETIGEPKEKAKKKERERERFTFELEILRTQIIFLASSK